MDNILQILNGLGPEGTDWLLAMGTELQVISGQVLIRTGETAPNIYIVMEGLVGIHIDALGNQAIRMLGPGEFVGEMSLLENKPAAATVIAAENSLLLVLERPIIEAKLKDDGSFAAKFYLAMAQLLSERLRSSMWTFGQRISKHAETQDAVGSKWTVLSEKMAVLKRLLVEADQMAIRNFGEMPAGIEEAIYMRFMEFVDDLNNELGDKASIPEDVRHELGARVQRELLPYVILTESGDRYYRKPRGYAGDFQTIENIYNNMPSGTGALGSALDRCFLGLPAARAVRNRRGLLRGEILRTVSAKQGNGPARILSLASGPAREIFDSFAELPEPSALHATCIDIDLQALAFVGDIRTRKRLRQHMTLENTNLVFLATGRQKFTGPSQDLIYSIGLIDYFNDSFVVHLLNFIYDQLVPGGRVILGNFHPDNKTKAFMDYVLDWKLIHRTEEDMHRLFQASKFARPCDEIRFEAERINLFAFGSRPS